MSEKITVFDEKNVMVGQTFMRRAKQLVAKGRAAWLDDSQTSICLTSKEAILLEGEDEMEHKTTGHDYDDSALLHMAKRNVRQRRILLCHILAFVLAVSAFLLIHEIVQGNTTRVHDSNILWHWDNMWREVNSIDELRIEALSRGHTVDGILVPQLSDIHNNLSMSISTFGHMTYFEGFYQSSSHPVWFFMWGIYLAWFIFILFLLFRYIAPRIKSSSTKRDPVVEEYMRLKRSVSSAVDLRSNN